jgi:large subunit ribosomal protein L24
MSSVHVKKNDTVVLLVGDRRFERESSGRSVLRRGRVLEVRSRDGKVLVEGFKMVKKHMRPDQRRGIAGGIIERESYIDISKVQVVCPACRRPTRVKWEVAVDGRKTRLCKRCHGNIDQ